MLLERKKLQLSLLQDCRRMKSYHLTWSNHVLTLETVFTSLLETEKLTDVTLLCDNGAIRAHKLILSACSNYFLRLFMELPCKHTVISLPEVAASTMRSLLAFIYNGEVSVEESTLEALMQAAESLEIRGLIKKDEDTKCPLATSSPPPPPPKKKKNISPEEEMEELRKALRKCQHLLDPKDTLVKAILQPPAPPTPPAPPPPKKPVCASPEPRKPVSFPEVSITPLLQQQPPSLQQLGNPFENPHLQQQQQLLLNSPYSSSNASAAASEFSPPSSSAAHSPGASSATSNPVDCSALANSDDVNKIMAQLPFPTCPLCSKDCANFPNLRSHLHTHLLGKPFSCEFCEAKFSRASHLCRHRRTHTGEKPFECRRCGKTFSRQDKLKTHMDRHLLREGGGQALVEAVEARKMSKKAKAARPKQNRVNSHPNLAPPPSLHQQHSHLQQEPPAAQQQQHLFSGGAWNNMAFPGLASPFFHAQQQQQQQMFPGAPQHYHNGSGRDPHVLAASLMKVGGELTVQQMPK